MPIQNEGSNINTTQSDAAPVASGSPPPEATRPMDAPSSHTDDAQFSNVAPSADAAQSTNASQPTDAFQPQSPPTVVSPPADATRLPNGPSQGAPTGSPAVQAQRTAPGAYSTGPRMPLWPRAHHTLRTNPWIWILFIVLLLALIVAIVVFSRQALSNSTTHTNDAAESANKSLVVGPAPVIVIDGHNTNVDVHTGAAGIVKVTAHNHNSNTFPNNSDTQIIYNQTTDNQGHTHLGINTQPGFRDIDYTLIVPSTAQVQITVNSGSVSVNGISGASIDTGSGSLDVENVQGPINVHTDSGDITVRNVKGSMKVDGSSGSLHITSVNGQLAATTRSGDVIVRQSTLSGQSVLRTNSGSVRYEGALDPKGSYRLQTDSGDVNLTLPANTAFQLAASTGSGSVHNDFDSDSTGSPPLAQITATTTSGSVTLNKE